MLLLANEVRGTCGEDFEHFFRLGQVTARPLSLAASPCLFFVRGIPFYFIYCIILARILVDLQPSDGDWVLVFLAFKNRGLLSTFFLS